MTVPREVIQGLIMADEHCDAPLPTLAFRVCAWLNLSLINRLLLPKHDSGHKDGTNRMCKRSGVSAYVWLNVTTRYLLGFFLHASRRVRRCDCFWLVARCSPSQPASSLIRTLTLVCPRVFSTRRIGREQGCRIDRA